LVIEDFFKKYLFGYILKLRFILVLLSALTSVSFANFNAHIMNKNADSMEIINGGGIKVHEPQS